MLYEITIRRLSPSQLSTRLKMLLCSLTLGSALALSVFFGHKVVGKVQTTQSDFHSVILEVGASLAIQFIGLAVICGVALAGHFHMKCIDPLGDLCRQSSCLAGLHFVGVFAAFVGVVMCFISPFEVGADWKGLAVYFTFGIISVAMWSLYLKSSMNW